MKAAHRVFPGLDGAGAGQDVVKLIEQHVAPTFVKALLPVFVPGQKARGGAEHFAFVQPVFAYVVCKLYAALAGVAAGKGKVVFPAVDGQAFAAFFKLRKEAAIGRKQNRGHDRPGGDLDQPVQIPARRPAAVVANAVHHEEVARGHLGAQQGIVCKQAGLDVGVVPVGLLIDQKLVPGRGAPHVGGAVILAAPTVIVVFDAACMAGLRHVYAVAEGVWLKVQIEACRIDVQKP